MSAAEMAQVLAAQGATLIQYRNKRGAGREVLAAAQAVKLVAGREGVTLILNDRADLAVAAGFDGVHLGQDDLHPTSARRVCPSPLLIGFSTHEAAQVQEADELPVDYIAIGPVFATGSKANPGPMVGLEGVHQARKLTRKPLVAIGGITRGNCRDVTAAGADAVAVISDLRQDPGRATADFLQLLG
jgi:thiamine-phosphate pyrophosphorylase